MNRGFGIGAYIGCMVMLSLNVAALTENWNWGGIASCASWMLWELVDRHAARSGGEG